MKKQIIFIGIFILSIINISIFAISNSLASEYGDDINPTKDTYVDFLNLSANYGESDELYVSNRYLLESATLIEFQLNDLPSNLEKLRFVTSDVYFTHIYQGGIVLRIFYFIGIPWNETNITASNEPFELENIWLNTDLE